MKSKSQTYGEYKVVKEVDLDGAWKTMGDSIQAGKVLIANSNKTIAALQAQVDSLRAFVQQKEASVQEVMYDGTHISVLGIDFGKSFFKVLVFILLALLTAGMITAVGRMKFMHRSLVAKTELADETAQEFAEYKRRAMEKQTKLARELQTELNKPGR